MNFPVAFLISISMNYATKLSTGCRRICRCCGTRTDRQIWIKLRYLLSYCRFFERPVPSIPTPAELASSRSLTLAPLSHPRAFCCAGSSKPFVPESAPEVVIVSGGRICLWRAYLSLEGVSVAGGCICLWRVELFALFLELLVRACRIALRGQNRPPGIRTPSGAEKVTKTPSRVD